LNIILNGVGRIGKAILRIANNLPNINIIAINELNANIHNIAYSINYDSTYGSLDDKYIVNKNFIQNNHSKIQILNQTDLTQIDFTNIDIMIDASGAKIDKNILEQLNLKYIFITHPSKDAMINIILGVNDKLFDKSKHKIISTSSCNATALLPALDIIEQQYGIEYGDITTIHPLLNHQKVLDSACVGNPNREVKCNFEFGRGSVQNIIPSGTTTIEACSYVSNYINANLISSSSLRVPTETVGAISVTLSVKKSCSKDDIINLFTQYQKTQQYNIVYNNFEPLVSSDFKKMDYTTIIDHRFTDVIKNKMIKLIIWYDNEWGYASKVIQMVQNCNL